MASGFLSLFSWMAPFFGFLGGLGKFIPLFFAGSIFLISIFFIGVDAIQQHDGMVFVKGVSMKIFSIDYNTNYIVQDMKANPDNYGIWQFLEILSNIILIVHIIIFGAMLLTGGYTWYGMLETAGILALIMYIAAGMLGTWTYIPYSGIFLMFANLPQVINGITHFPQLGNKLRALIDETADQKYLDLLYNKTK